MKMPEMSKVEILELLHRELRPFFKKDEYTVDIKCNRCVQVFIKVKGIKALRWLWDAHFNQSQRLLSIGNTISLSNRDYKLTLVLYISKLNHEPFIG